MCTLVDIWTKPIMPLTVYMFLQRLEVLHSVCDNALISGWGAYGGGRLTQTGRNAKQWPGALELGGRPLGGCGAVAITDATWFRLHTYSAVYTYVSGQWPTWRRSPIGQRAVSLGRHELVSVSEQDTNKPLGTTKSFIKSQNSMACILSFVVPIQLKILHDIDKSVFLIVTKFGSDTMSHLSAVTE